MAYQYIEAPKIEEIKNDFSAFLAGGISNCEDWQANAAQNFVNRVESATNADNVQALRNRVSQNLGAVGNTARRTVSNIRTGATAQLAKLAPAVDNTLSGIKTTLQTLFGSIRDSKTLQSVLAKWNELDAAIRAQLGNEIQAASVPYPPAAGRKRTRRIKRKNRKH
jgi:seryl-tRNA synthetase